MQEPLPIEILYICHNASVTSKTLPIAIALKEILSKQILAIYILK
jgi:hypothetical protein